MKTLWEFLATFWKNIRPWTIIQPWELALRVRFGKTIRPLNPGTHFKLPMFDAIYVQSVRRRVINLDTQTVQTADGRTVIAGGCIAYEIVDIAALYSTLHHPEDALQRDAMIALAREIRERQADDCKAQSIEDATLKRLEFARYGVNLLELYLTDFAFGRTYRLINAPRYNTHGDTLKTSEANG